MGEVLAFIGDLVKLEKAHDSMFLLDVAGEAQVCKVELPRLSV